MAVWCYTTRQTPEVYRSLNRAQRAVFADMSRKLREKGW